MTAGGESRGGEQPKGLEETTIPVRHRDEATVVSVDEGTIAVARPRETRQASPHMQPEPHPAAAQLGSRHTSSPGARSTTGGDPVEDPQRIPDDLARLLFKSPLDPKRRAPESPFSGEPLTLPRGGVRAGIPVVYGARAQELQPTLPDTALAARVGSPPAGYALPEADRTALPSLARMNRRYSWVAKTGAAVLPVAVGFGMWGVLTLLLQP